MISPRSRQSAGSVLERAGLAGEEGLALPLAQKGLTLFRPEECSLNEGMPSLGQTLVPRASLA